jgi:hypothetical protein
MVEVSGAPDLIIPLKDFLNLSIAEAVPLSDLLLDLPVPD